MPGDWCFRHGVGMIRTGTPKGSLQVRREEVPWENAELDKN